MGTQTQVVGAGDCLDELLATSPYSDDVNPAATEFCDSWDTDCDSQPSYPANDGLPESAAEIDDDGDGYVQCDFPAFAFAGGALNNGYGGVVMGSDCLDVLLTINPYSDDVNPGEVEVCDSWDTDCSSQSAYPSNDGAPDDAGETDQDGDGYVPCDYNAAANNGGAESNGYGSVIDGGDCLDMAPAGNPYAANVNPGSLSDTLANVASTCDGWDTDCSNQPAYPNNDGEPCGNDGLCPGEAGYTSPDAGEDDLGEFDADGDGYIACFNGPSSAPSLAPGAANNGPAVGTQTQVVGAGDCLDELLATSPYSDDVNPAATETCDSWDTDCDSQPGYPNNDGLPEAAEENDDDADGYVQCDYSGVALARGALNNGYGGVVMGSDCLDVSLATNAYSDNVNPGEVETCDSWDTDCSGQPPWPSNDGAPDDPDEVDDDGDTYIHCDFSAAAATGGAIDNGYGTVIDGGDCLDETTASNPYADNVNPAATEICDSFDTDCSNQSPYPGNDGEPEDADERDQDGDGYIQCDLSTGAIVGGALGNGFGGVFAGGDCLDVSLSTNAYSDDVNPAATEICDSWDTDCNSQPSYPGNDGTPEDPDEIDDDSDGYFECDLVAGAAGNTRNGALGGDCLDEVGGLSYPLANAADPSITFAQAGAVNPGASEVCDGFDTDCSSGNTVFVVDPVQEPNEYDADFDDHMICASLQSWTPIGLLGGDCDNNLATGSGINPSVAPDDYSSPLTDNDCDGLYDEDAWSAGDLAITEVMVDPGGGSTEWFEVYNQSGRTLSLQGLVLSDQGSESWTLSEDSRIGNGDYAILCAMPFAYPGGSGGYASGCLNGVGFFSFTLSNGSDEIVLSMAGATIDVVAWTSSASNTTDASTGLDPNATPYETANTTLNLASADWCQSSNAWPGGGGAMGSPGVQNQPCNLSSMDLDGDGFCADGRDTRGVGAGSPPDGDCDDPGEQSTSNYDCFDDGADAYASNVNTASFEVCDGYDTDCSNSGVPPADEQDDDGDGFLPCDNWVATSSAAFAGGHDCLDVSTATNSSSDDVNPGATEACDGFDTDCSVYAGGGANTYAPDQANEVDTDLDRFIVCASFVSATTAQNGLATTLVGGSDCLEDGSNPWSGNVNPAAIEACDGYDTDCVGGLGAAGEVDSDSDGYMVCDNVAGWNVGGNFAGGGDCDDNTASTAPLAGDSVAGDSIDQDCDGLDCLAGDGAIGVGYSSGPYYIYCADSVTQPAAIAACEGASPLGNRTVRLAEAYNSSDNNELSNLLGAGETAWIGATDGAVEGVFLWDAGPNNSGTNDPCNSGSGSSPYCNWATSQPSGANDCVAMDDGGEWFDSNCALSGPTGYLCEVP